MTRTRRRYHRLPARATAVAATLVVAGALGVVGPAVAQQGTAPASTTGAGQSAVGDTGHGNSLPMPANPATQTGRTPMQNQSNPGAAAAGGGGADQSATTGTTARKQLPPEPGQSANQQGTGRSVDVRTGGGSDQQQQMLQPQQQQPNQGAGQPTGQRAAAPSVELQSSGTKAQQPVTRQSLEPQERTGNGPSGLERGEPGGETKVTPGGGESGGGGGGTTSAGGIPVAPQGSGTR